MAADYRFYVSDTTLEDEACPEGCEVALWRPTPTEPLPPGVEGRRFQVWNAMHRLGLFKNKDYSILLMRRGDRVVHRSCVFPGFFRFPFMGQDDLQIGDTFTDESERGKGLATYAIREAVRRLARPGRRVWYVVDEENVPSIKAAERAGMRLVGRGERRKRLGLGALAAYVMTQDVQDDPR